MRAVLAAYGDETRCVLLADSFAGVPRPDTANCRHIKGLGWTDVIRPRTLRGSNSVRRGVTCPNLLDFRSIVPGIGVMLPGRLG
jgi:hypothetical protein